MFTTLTILICLSLYLLFAPVVLEIDTAAGICRVRYHVLIAAGLYPENKSLTLYLRILPWKIRYDLYELMYAPSRHKPEKPKNRKRKNISFGLIMAIAGSFRVRKFSLAIDTGNEALNGMIYPLCAIKHVDVNFMGRNELALVITNNAARVLWAIIKNRYHSSLKR